MRLDCSEIGCEKKADMYKASGKFALCIDYIISAAFDFAYEKWKQAQVLKCHFCGKSQDQVKKLIAGSEVYICDECVDLCNEILEEGTEEPEKAENHA